MTDTEYGFGRLNKYWEAIAYDHHNSRPPKEWTRLTIRFVAGLVLFAGVAAAGMTAIGYSHITSNPTVPYAVLDLLFFLSEAVSSALAAAAGICLLKAAIAINQREYRRSE